MRRFIWIFLLFSSVLILSPQLALTQNQPEICPALVVEEALTTLGANCSNMEVNTACYGYNRVNLTQTLEDGPDLFTQPNARAQLTALTSIQTAPNEQGLGWGIAVLNLQGNLPDTAAGQAVNILLLGGTEIENAVAQSDTTLTPMQAFYFRPGFGPAACSRVPSALAIRSPRGENITVDLVANGARIRLGSTAVLRVLPPGNTLQVMTIEGRAILDAETPQQLTVPAGFSTLRCLSQLQNLGEDGNANDREVIQSCPWEAPIPLTEEEVTLGDTVNDLFSRLDGCPNGGQDVVHVVRRGENLFRIARRYRTSVSAIAEANGISNPAAITPGQELLIHCAVDTGASTFPPIIPIPVTSPLTSGP
jgi:nucleoid-associated protein YgaU